MDAEIRLSPEQVFEALQDYLKKQGITASLKEFVHHDSVEYQPGSKEYYRLTVTLYDSRDTE